MDYPQYIAAHLFLSVLEEEKRKMNVRSADVVGKLNKKIEVVEKFIEKRNEMFLAELIEQIKSE